MEILHLEDKHRFSSMVQGHECLLSYKIVSPGVLDFYHTFVSPELRGMKIAEKITQYAMDYVRENDFKMIPTCPYVQRFLDMHPEYNDLIAED